MLPPATIQTSRRRRIRVIGALLAALVVRSSWVQAEPAVMTVEPRIVEATLGRISLEQVDVSLWVALRASQAATIRSITFTDAFVGPVPVWVERIEGSWPLVAGQELVIPQALRVRMLARDAVGTLDLGAVTRAGSVVVRASVEVEVETPRLARLLFMGQTRTLVRDVELDMPIQAGPAQARPLTALGADLAGGLQRGAATWLVSGLDRLTGRHAVAARFDGVVAAVTTRYVVDGGSTPVSRERRAAGLWWSPGVFCTTREAIAPWRFDVTDAIALQHRGARLRSEGRVVLVGATRERPPLTLDLAAIEALLPTLRERKVHTLIDGRRRGLRLGDRDADSNLVCLQVADDSPVLRPATPSGPVRGDVAAFSPGASLGVVWTAVTAMHDDRLQLTRPVYRVSFGSPLVSGDRIVGVVASSTTAWSTATVASAAARAPRLPPTTSAPAAGGAR
jgi:hypothetical protein